MGVMRNVRTFFVKKKTYGKLKTWDTKGRRGEHQGRSARKRACGAGVGGIDAASKRVQWRDVNTSMNIGSHKKGRIS